MSIRWPAPARNEAKGLIGRMSDEEIYGTFATIVASGYGKAVGADLKHGESKENLYPFIATMIHYLSYSPQMEGRGRGAAGPPGWWCRPSPGV